MRKPRHADRVAQERRDTMRDRLADARTKYQQTEACGFMLVYDPEDDWDLSGERLN